MTLRMLFRQSQGGAKSRNIYLNSNDLFELGQLGRLDLDGFYKNFYVVYRCHPLPIVERKATFLIASVRAKQIQGE